MQLTTWNPFREMDEIFNRANQGLSARLPDGEWMPSVDITESDKGYLVKAELPGVDKKDVHLTIENHVLTLEGERKSEKESKDEKVHRVERFYGHFTRSFNLPEDADEEGIKAESKDGMLSVHIPKSKSARAKKLEVEVH